MLALPLVRSHIQWKNQTVLTMEQSHILHTESKILPQRDKFLFPLDPSFTLEAELFNHQRWSLPNPSCPFPLSGSLWLATYGSLGCASIKQQNIIQWWITCSTVDLQHLKFWANRDGESPLPRNWRRSGCRRQLWATQVNQRSHVFSTGRPSNTVQGWQFKFWDDVIKLSTESDLS